MTVPSFVGAAAADDIRAAAEEIGLPAATDLAAKAASLAYDARSLADALQAAVGAVADPAVLESLAAAPLAGLRPVPQTTANRRRQARNRAALADYLGGLASVRLAEVLSAATWPDRPQALDARNRVVDALDVRAAGAPALVYAALRTLATVATDRIAATAGELPEIIEAEPGGVLPTLVLAWRWYASTDRADGIARHAGAVRPGFVPADPIRIEAP